MAKLPNLPDLPEKEPPGGWPVDSHFDGQEDMFRRIHPDAFVGAQIALDAIELPDMSVNRGKYGYPNWLLRGYPEWGVAKFKIKDIPESLRDGDVREYTFRPVHVPLDNAYRYPHSEVRAYENGIHVNAKEKLDPMLHLRWRHRLRLVLKLAIKPSGG